MMTNDYEEDELNREALIAIKECENEYLDLFDQDYLISTNLMDINDSRITIDEFLNLKR